MSVFKTAAGAEFCELIEEARKLGLRPAEVARRMKLSKPTVHNYIVGKIEPPASRIDALKRILEDIKQPVKYSSAEESVVGTRNANVDKAADRLQEIHQADPSAFEAMEKVILHTRNSVVKPSANSAALSQAVATAPGALKKALREAQESSPSHKAGGPISYKRARARGTDKRSKSPPASPTQAPK